MLSARSREVLALALPIIGAMTSQNILNLVDTALVGGLGPAALAGVGLASFLTFMAVGFITGLSSAVQAVAARRYGEGRLGETALPLNGGLLLSLALGLPLSALMILFAPEILGLLNDDPAVVAEGTPYLQWRLVSVAAIGMNFSFRGYWSAVKLARLYLYTLLWMHSLNIVLNWALIYGHFGLPALGTTGAGIGTTVSILIGTATYFWLGARHARPAGFLIARPSGEQLRNLLRLGLPSSVQQLLFAAGFTVLFWIVGQVGTAELAVANVLINITLVAVLPGIGFGLAAATLAGQALGRGDPVDAHRWPWDVYRVALGLFALIGLPMVVCPELLLGLFLRDPALVALGTLPLRLIGLGILIDGLGLILMHALFGVGAARLVMGVTVGLQWGLFLPLAWLLGPVWGLGLSSIWLAMTAYRGLQSLVLAAAWQKRAWVRIKV
ncbi:MAG TPA: MATE family efflux transporter [Nevskiaceae bacterium]|nr:MATE family efflux transporter [Nevskiaceae bacterium]